MLQSNQERADVLQALQALIVSDTKVKIDGTTEDDANKLIAANMNAAVLNMSNWALQQSRGEQTLVQALLARESQNFTRALESYMPMTTRNMVSIAAAAAVEAGDLTQKNFSDLLGSGFKGVQSLVGYVKSHVQSSRSVLEKIKQRLGDALTPVIEKYQEGGLPGLIWGAWGHLFGNAGGDVDTGIYGSGSFAGGRLRGGLTEEEELKVMLKIGLLKAQLLQESAQRAGAVKNKAGGKGPAPQYVVQKKGRIELKPVSQHVLNQLFADGQRLKSAMTAKIGGNGTNVSKESIETILTHGTYSNILPGVVVEPMKNQAPIYPSQNILMIGDTDDHGMSADDGGYQELSRQMRQGLSKLHVEGYKRDDLST
jgi:hypothetical protein